MIVIHGSLSYNFSAVFSKVHGRIFFFLSCHRPVTSCIAWLLLSGNVFPPHPNPSPLLVRKTALITQEARRKCTSYKQSVTQSYHAQCWYAAGSVLGSGRTAASSGLARKHCLTKVAAPAHSVHRNPYSNRYYLRKRPFSIILIFPSTCTRLRNLQVSLVSDL